MRFCLHDCYTLVPAFPFPARALLLRPAVTGHPVSESWMQGLQRVGIGILVLLMAVAVFNDIQRLFAA